MKAKLAVRRNGAVIAVYTYDGNGNRTQEDSEDGLAAATYDDQDRLLAYGAHTAGALARMPPRSSQLRGASAILRTRSDSRWSLCSVDPEA